MRGLFDLTELATIDAELARYIATVMLGQTGPWDHGKNRTGRARHGIALPPCPERLGILPERVFRHPLARCITLTFYRDPPPPHPPPRPSLGASLLLHATVCSDIQFVVGEDREKVYAHKIILSGRCEVFRAMFAEQRHQHKGAAKKEGGSALLVLPDVRPT